MTGFELARISLSRKKTATAFAVLCVALGTLASSLLVTLVGGTTATLDRLETPFDVIVGPKSSGLAVLLGGIGAREPSSDYIPFSLSQYLDRRIFPHHQIPLAAFSMVQGLPVFGTDRRYLDRPEELRPPAIREGRWFEAPGEAVLGEAFAATLGLRVGETFAAAGMLESPTGETWSRELTVVGLLDHSYGDAFSGAGFVSLETGWEYYRWAFAHHLARPARDREVVTYILASLEEGQMEVFERRIHGQSVAQLVKTGRETEFLQSLTSGSRWAAIGFCLAAILIAATGIAVLANARFEFLRPELGLLRALGYPKSTIAWWLVWETLTVTLLALVCSVPLEALGVLGLAIPYELGLTVTKTPWPTYWNMAVWAGVFLACLGATLFTLIRLYRMDVQSSMKGV